MVAAREVELLVVEPPRHVHVHAADAVLVVRHVVHHRRDESGDVGAGRVGEVLAHHAAGVGEPLREAATTCELAGSARDSQRARREHHDARAHVLVRAGGLVDVRHAGRQSVRADRHLARHRVGEQREPAGRERRRDEHVGTREVRVRPCSRDCTARSSGTPVGR